MFHWVPAQRTALPVAHLWDKVHGRVKSTCGASTGARRRGAAAAAAAGIGLADMDTGGPADGVGLLQQRQGPSLIAFLGWLCSCDPNFARSAGLLTPVCLSLLSGFPARRRAC